MNGFLTAREAAAAIRRRPRYVRDLIRAGRLRALRLVEGGSYLIDARSFSEFCGEPTEKYVDDREARRRAGDVAARLGFSRQPAPDRSECERKSVSFGVECDRAAY